MHNMPTHPLTAQTDLAHHTHGTTPTLAPPLQMEYQSAVVPGDSMRSGQNYKRSSTGGSTGGAVDRSYRGSSGGGAAAAATGSGEVSHHSRSNHMARARSQRIPEHEEHRGLGDGGGSGGYGSIGPESLYYSEVHGPPPRVSTDGGSVESGGGAEGASTHSTSLFKTRSMRSMRGVTLERMASGMMVARYEAGSSTVHGGGAGMDGDSSDGGGSLSPAPSLGA